MRSTLACALTATLSALVLSGCGASSGDPSASSSTEGGAVVVEHVFGETEVPSTPQRVVTLDLQWTDTMLALGVEPVGVADDPSMPDGGVPWQPDLGDAVALDVGAGLPYEEISDLEPDLIVGSYVIADQEAYDTLSQIAPTVASLQDLQVDDWTELVSTGGRVLGAEDEADALVAEVESEISTTVSDLPGLSGKSFLLSAYTPGEGFIAVGDTEDGSSRLFQELGMELNPTVREESESTDEPRVEISTELTDMLDSDLLVLALLGAEESDLADVPGFTDLRGTIELLDYADVVALNTPSALSVPYALERLRPSLEAVASP